jgi:alkyl sulfatase BDS1-like metallo-beta-lactamase superfamily hydrolase
MTEFDATRYDQLVASVKSKSTDELVAEVQASPGGIDGTLQQVFAGMVGAFNPAKAGDADAVVQYEVNGPDGPHPYWMRIAGGTCTIEPGSVESPKATLRIGLADFLRLIAGTLNPMNALMTGKLKVQGDLFFLQTMQNWFDRD